MGGGEILRCRTCKRASFRPWPWTWGLRRPWNAQRPAAAAHGTALRSSGHSQAPRAPELARTSCLGLTHESKSGASMANYK